MKFISNLKKISSNETYTKYKNAYVTFGRFLTSSPKMPFGIFPEKTIFSTKINLNLIT